jgi:tetratricopeptide (TPR) repeat protein
MFEPELEALQNAVRNQDWGLIQKTAKDILDKGPEGDFKDLAAGFAHLDTEKAITELEKAQGKFEGTDDTFYTLVGTERLILLVHHDKNNSKEHLRDLGEFSLARYEKTRDPTQARMAIEALEGARSGFEGDDLKEINLKLMTAYAQFLEHSKDQGDTYKKLVEVCRDVRDCLDEKSPVAARTMMNEAVACQGLASCDEKEALGHLKDSEKLIEEAITIFQDQDSGPEVVRAKQYLANIMRDRAARDPQMTIECLNEVINIKAETADLYEAAGYMVNSGYEVMDSGVALIELSSVDTGNARAHLERAGQRFEDAAAIFQKEESNEELAQAKMGIAVVIKSLAPLLKEEERSGKLKEAISVYDEAAKIFKKSEKAPEYKMALENQAAALDELAEADSKNAEAHKKEAARLRHEAEGLVTGSE